MSETTDTSSFHIMAKPTGPSCNLNCSYCFYLEKEAFFPDRNACRMSDTVLEAYIRNTIESSEGGRDILFAWQGGEPTLMKIDFYRKAFSLQRKFAGGRIVKNSFQTNGVLLNDAWCRLFKENDVLVGLSLDGPSHIHNRYRKDRSGKGAFDSVMAGLEYLKKHDVDVNALCCVTRESPEEALEVYHFLKEQGVRYMQFIPIVERIPGREDREMGLSLAPAPTAPAPPGGGTGSQIIPELTPWSVSPDGFGSFLISVFDEWVRNDVGDIFVMNFDWTLNSWLYGNSPACVYATRCGNAVILEHNGDIYSCDHYMYPDYKLGNILKDDLSALLNSETQEAFGAAKEKTLTRMCRECDVLFACHGDCPKHRFEVSDEGERGQSYLCPSYKRFFRYADRFMRPMSQLVRENLPVSHIKDAFDGPLFIRKD